MHSQNIAQELRSANVLSQSEAGPYEPTQSKSIYARIRGWKNVVCVFKKIRSNWAVVEKSQLVSQKALLE